MEPDPAQANFGMIKQAPGGRYPSSQCWDILTIIIRKPEHSKNTSKARTKPQAWTRDRGFSVQPSSSLLTKKGQLPSMKLSSGSFESDGNVSSSERINTRLSVRIIDML